MAVWITFFALNGLLISGAIQLYIFGVDPPEFYWMILGIVLGGITGGVLWKYFQRGERS